MKTALFFLFFFLSIRETVGQTIAQKLQRAFAAFETDDQMKNGISSLYVIDAATGQVVFEKNGRMGLAPASTQKIITSATAFELLGPEYRYETRMTLDTTGGENRIIVYGNGDPTLGSWRWPQHSEEAVMRRFVNAIQNERITDIRDVSVNVNSWNTETIPDGWIWQDIGNYYGAGAEGLNWHENQYDIVLKSSDKVGEPVEIVKTVPYAYNIDFFDNRDFLSAPKGTGDNAYVYYPISGYHAIIRGTIPAGESNFRISAAVRSGLRQFHSTFLNALSENGIRAGSLNFQTSAAENKNREKLIHVEQSPRLDSIIYWFNKKSVNLYGEALVKTLALEKYDYASTDSGVSILRKFWKGKGIPENELNMYDGSGLSPLNRVTTHAQVEILKYARKQDWFGAFFESLPEYNNMKMKSGTISDVKGFCGYHKAKNGKEYIFSFLVNNYSGRSSSIVTKMYQVLDFLK